MTATPSDTALTAEIFREVLGHYPTGVVVVTAVLPNGQPTGMVIGSFTSVSLDPPMVAYLPTATSKTYASMQGVEDFCINVLAADQEDLCRQLAVSSEDKFAGIGWSAAPSGAPIIDGVVAWIDCRVESVTEAGDHHIVLGRVRSLDVARPTLPLLFFQGGYGRFTPRSLVVPDGRQFIQSVRMAETARCTLDRLAEEMGVECTMTVRDGSDSVFAATANHSRTQGRTRLGARVPIKAPIGPLFVPAGQGATQPWLSWLRDENLRDMATAQLRRVRERGWSVGVLGDISQGELDRAVQEYSSSARTPAAERAFVELLVRMMPQHEPELTVDGTYDVLHLSAPVVLAGGEVPMALRLGELPRGMSGRQIKELATRLVAEAEAIARQVEGSRS